MSTKPAATTVTAPEVAPVPELGTGHLSRVFRAFKYRNFRLLWFGAFTSSSGTWLQQAAQSWLLFQLTGKDFYLSLDSFLSTAPIILFSLIGGVIADRVDRRRILLASQWLQLSCAFTLAILFAAGAWNRVLVVSMLSLSFLTGCAQAFGGPAYQALIPQLVDKRDLVNAVTLNSIQFNLARIVGPAIGSIPFALISNVMFAAAVSFGLNGLSFVAVIAALTALHLSRIPRSRESQNTHWREDLKTGLRFVMHSEALGSLTLLSFSSAFLGAQLMTFLPVFAKEIFGTGAGGFATLLSTSGAGAVAGALIIAAFGDAIEKKGRAALLIQVFFGGVVVVFAQNHLLWFAYPLIFLSGAAMMMLFALIMSLVQLTAVDAMRGRVMSIYMVAVRGAMPLGALTTSGLAWKFPISAVITVEGVLLSILAVGFLISPSTVKRQ